MPDRKSEQAPRPGTTLGSSAAARISPSPAEIGAPERGSASPRSRNDSGFEARRALPPVGASANTPGQTVPAKSYDGSGPQQKVDAVIKKTRAASPAPQLPVTPLGPALDQPVPTKPDPQLAGQANPVAPTGPVSGGFDPYRELTEIRSDRTAQLPRDPDTPAGPTPALATALVQARLRSDDRQRARRQPQQNAASEVSYVKTAAAEAKQIHRGKRLYARYRRECGLQMVSDEDIDPCDFVDWLLSRKPMLSGTSTWRIYRGSALTWLRKVPHVRREEAVAILEADIGADRGRAGPYSQRGGSERAEHAKRFARADFDEVLDQVGKLSRSEAVPWLCDWLMAGVYTGLEPGEWAATFLEVPDDSDQRPGRQAWLHVLNTKASVGANPVKRTLDISNFSASALAAVSRHAKRASEWSQKDQFEMRHSQCAQLLYKVCSARFRRQQQRYSLLSLRHQFIANMLSIYQPAEAAALVGHLSSEDTVVDHYAKRRAAWLREEIGEVPVPTPKQAKRMRRQWELYKEALDVKKLRQNLIERRRKTKAKVKKSKPPT